MAVCARGVGYFRMTTPLSTVRQVASTIPQVGGGFTSDWISATPLKLPIRADFSLAKPRLPVVTPPATPDSPTRRQPKPDARRILGNIS
jgi:hypothetical protein